MPPLGEARKGSRLRTPATGFPSFIEKSRKPRIITGDIWACLGHLMEDLLPQEREREALGYVQQAEEFYQGAENPQIRSRPLLYYYSFLNVSKALLIARGVDLPPRTHHGITDPKANIRKRHRFEGQKVHSLDVRADSSNVFPELVGQFEPPRDKNFRVLDLLGQVPSVHRTYSIVTGTESSPKFMPARFELLSDSGEVWARLIVNRRDADVQRTLKAVRKRKAFWSVFTQKAAPKRKGEKESDEIWFETVPEVGVKKGIDGAVARLGDAVRSCGVWSVLTSTGYRHYLGTFAPADRLPQLASSYAIMFYLGSITRYKPYDFDRIVSGRYAWLVNEFLASQPRQFLYLSASILAGVDVVRPFAVN